MLRLFLITLVLISVVLGGSLKEKSLVGRLDNENVLRRKLYACADGEPQKGDYPNRIMYDNAHREWYVTCVMSAQDAEELAI